MAKLTELSINAHKNLKVTNDAMMSHASRQHVCNLQAQEIANAATCFPVFITRNSINGQLAVSAMMSFATQENLFVQDNSWHSVFQPTNFRTYPLYLMQSPENEKHFTIGFDQDSGHLSEEHGLALFTGDGKATPMLSEKTKLLEGELEQMRLTYAFTKMIDSLDLMKSVDLQVHYQSGEVGVIKGLQTIDEDKLQTISTDDLDKLRKAGYLAPIYAMLMSLFQINVLINKHNNLTTHTNIDTVKIEVSKDTTVS